MKNSILPYFWVILLIFITGTSTAIGQRRIEPYLSLDLTSAYLWRGEKNAGPSIQPVLGMKWRGLNFYIWGNAQLSPPSGQKPVKHEIDFFLKYSISRNFIVGFKDVYINTRGNGLFSYGSIPHAANGLDVLLHYNWKCLNLEWTTTIAGYDGYNHNGKRAFGSYLIASAPFHYAYFDWTPSIGIVPYYCSRYSPDQSRGFHVNMAAIKASHSFKLDKKDATSIAPYMQLMVNPSSRDAFFQAGAVFKFEAAKLMQN